MKKREWLFPLSSLVGDGYFKDGLATYAAKNYAEALTLFENTVKQGNVSASFYLGVMYYEGDGVEKNDTQATHWWTKAAEQDHTQAQFNLGLMYYEGKGVEKNDTQAMHWWTKAAEQGHTQAQYNLAAMYD